MYIPVTQETVFLYPCKPHSHYKLIVLIILNSKLCYLVLGIMLNAHRPGDAQHYKLTVGFTDLLAVWTTYSVEGNFTPFY